ncbi:MAG: IS982 family transposase [Cyclobacteriaceae bacterium]
MLTSSKIVEIFCSIDDFCLEFAPKWKNHLIGQAKKRYKPNKLCLSEIMTIQMLFHLSGYRNFKTFYLAMIKGHLQSYFPKAVIYNRMVELMKESLIPLAIYLKTNAIGDCTGISFIDSTPLRVCHNRRIHKHKVFDGLAGRGQCSIGWFYGFKLHLIVAETGEIVDFMLTPGNVDDRKPLKIERFVKKLFGKLFGDKGYTGKELFKNLFFRGVHLVTKLKKNMKSKNVTPIMDAILLRKRAVCESIIDQLKNIFQIEHSRHRSPSNFLNNLFAALIAYNFTEKKPSITASIPILNNYFYQFEK